MFPAVYLVVHHKSPLGFTSQFIFVIGKQSGSSHDFRMPCRSLQYTLHHLDELQITALIFGQYDLAWFMKNRQNNTYLASL